MIRFDSDYMAGAHPEVIEALVDLIDTFGTLPTLIGAFAGGLSAFKNQGILKFDKNAFNVNDRNFRC